MTSRISLFHPSLLTSLGDEELSVYAERLLRSGSSLREVRGLISEPSRFAAALVSIVLRLNSRPLSFEVDSLLLSRLAESAQVLLENDIEASFTLVRAIPELLPFGMAESAMLEPWIEYLATFERVRMEMILVAVLERLPTGGLLRLSARAAAIGNLPACADLLAEAVTESVLKYRELLWDYSKVIPGAPAGVETELVERAVEIGSYRPDAVFLGIEAALVARGVIIDTVFESLVKLGRGCRNHIGIWRLVANEGPDTIGWESALVLLGRCAPGEAEAIARRFCSR